MLGCLRLWKGGHESQVGKSRLRWSSQATNGSKDHEFDSYACTKGDRHYDFRKAASAAERETAGSRWIFVGSLKFSVNLTLLIALRVLRSTVENL
jgi:hypothetical protein